MTEKSLLKALRGEPATRPPFWLMRQAGRYLPEYRALRERERDFLAFCYNPELAIEATMQPIRLFAPDAAILFADILVVCDALGRDVRFVEGTGPVLEPLRSAPEVGRLVDTDTAVAHLSPVIETVRGLAAALPSEVALIGFAGAPWTVAVYMVEGRGGSDFSQVRRWAYAEDGGFERLIASLVDCTTAYLSRQIEAGADAVQLFDTWAGVLPETEFRRWVIAPTAEIVRRLKERHPDVPVIGFPRAAGVQYEAYVALTGVDAVGIDAGVPLSWAAEVLQSRVAVQGNLDNQLLVIGGEAMDAEVDRILTALGRGPFVFNLGHGVVPQTPPDNVARLADRIRSWDSGL